MERRSVVGPAVLSLVVLASLAPATAQVFQPLRVKLGLWEATTVVQMSGALPDLDRMTPEQRARAEAAMERAKKLEATPHTFRTCLTAEKLEKMPFQDRDNLACKPEVVSSSATEFAVKFDCANFNGGSANGQWRFEAATPEQVNGSGEITVERGSRKMVSTTTLTAKWVGAACGDVK